MVFLLAVEFIAEAVQLPQPLPVAAPLPLGAHDSEVPGQELVVSNVQTQALEAVHAEESGEEVMEVFVGLHPELVTAEIQDIYHHALVVEQEVECDGKVLQDTIFTKVALSNAEDFQVVFDQEYLQVFDRNVAMRDLDLGQVDSPDSQVWVFCNVSENAASWVHSDVVQLQGVKTEPVGPVEEPVDDEIWQVHVAELVVLEVVARLSHGDNACVELRLDRDGSPVNDDLRHVKQLVLEGVGDQKGLGDNLKAVEHDAACVDGENSAVTPIDVVDESSQETSEALRQAGQVDSTQCQFFQSGLVRYDVPQVPKETVQGEDIDAGVVRLLVVYQSQLPQVLVRSAVICTNVLVVCQDGKEVGNGVDEMREGGDVWSLEVEVFEIAGVTT